MGRKAEEISGKTDFDLHPKALAEKYRADDQRVMETGRRAELDEEHESLAGETNYVHVIKSPLFDSAGRIAGVLGVFWDITKRKLAEDALKISEEKYRTILDTIEEGYYEADLRGRITFVNQAFCKIYGRSKSEIIGSHGLQYTDKESAKMVRALFNMSYTSGEPITGFGYPIFIEDGQTVYVHYSVAVIRNDLGEPIGFRGVVRDETKRKSAEEELRKRARELAAINALATKVSSSLSLDPVIKATLEQVSASVHSDLVLLFIKEGDKLLFRGVSPDDAGISSENFPGHQVGECLCGTSADQARPIYSLDINSDPRCARDHCKIYGFKSFAALPLVSGDQVVGILGVASLEKNDYSQQSAFLEILASEVAIGLRNAILYQEIQKKNRAASRTG